jgi:hypothetical protein
MHVPLQTIWKGTVWDALDRLWRSFYTASYQYGAMDAPGVASIPIKVHSESDRYACTRHASLERSFLHTRQAHITNSLYIKRRLQDQAPQSQCTWERDWTAWRKNSRQFKGSIIFTLYRDVSSNVPANEGCLDVADRIPWYPNCMHHSA